MKTLSTALQAHLDTRATTLCWCWRLTRRDGPVLGFTDHDRDLTVDGTTFEAAAGFTATEIKDAVGLSVDNLDVEGALQSGRLEEAALASGAFDEARIEIFRVNWADTSQRVLMRSGSLGEVKRSGGAFTAEVRGLAHYLAQPKGRLYQYTCDADLGDARCGIALTSAVYRGTGVVASLLSPRTFTATGLAAYADGWFARGLITFSTGANAGRSIEVKRHAVAAGVVTIEMWAELGASPAISDTFQVSAGCDKHLATCRDRFANVVNFRGFPHMPGNDFRHVVRWSGAQLMSAITRDAIVTEARRWIGTPYHHQASVIGVGADCLGLVRGVWRTLHGFEAEAPPAYSRDWAEASGAETLLAAAWRHLLPVPLAAMQPGHVLIFRIRPRCSSQARRHSRDHRHIHPRDGRRSRLRSAARALVAAAHRGRLRVRVQRNLKEPPWRRSLSRLPVLRPARRYCRLASRCSAPRSAVQPSARRSGRSPARSSTMLCSRHPGRRAT